MVEKFSESWDKMAFTENWKKRNQYQERRRREHKERFETILKKDLDERTLEENEFYLHYVLVQVCRRRRSRRRSLLNARLKKTTERTLSKFNSTLYTTGLKTSNEFLNCLRDEFESQYPEEDFYNMICSVDENGRVNYHLDERIP